MNDWINSKWFKTWLVLAGATCLMCMSVNAAVTRYIDWDNGLDANSGAATNAAWKHHPYMTGWTGTYTHSAGDQFIFKGGVTWPVAAFPMQVINHNGSFGTRDYYGVSTNWYAGTNWTRPLFDFATTALPGYGKLGSGLLIEDTLNVTVDGIEFANHRARLEWGSTTIMVYGISDNITFTNCLARNWQTTGTGSGTDAGGGFWNLGSGTNILGTHCTAHQSGNSNITSVGFRNFSKVEYCLIYNLCNGMINVGIAHDNIIHDILACSDPSAHHNAIGLVAPAQIYNNLMYNLSSGAAPLFLSQDFSYNPTTNTPPDLVYNNIIYGVGVQPPIQIDTGGGTLVTNCQYRIFNNTLVGNGSSPVLRVVGRGTNVPPREYKLLEMRNNLVITSGSPYGYNTSPYSGPIPPADGVVTTIINSSNLVYTAAQAAAAGFSSTNFYAPIYTNGTYRGGGENLSAYFTTDYSGATRSGAWDIGANQYASGGGGGGGDIPIPPVVSTNILRVRGAVRAGRTVKR